MASHNSCTVYIDEAGDLGANRGTKWFVLTAAIVDAIDELPIVRAINEIKKRLNLQKIHFRNVKDFNKRCFIISELSNKNFQLVHVLFDTSRYDKSIMPNERIAYNHVCRLLLARVSCLLKGTGRKGNVVLASRGTSKDNELMDYIINSLFPSLGEQSADVFTGVECKPASAWNMLQLADICATSMFYSHEINGYGFTTPCFAIRISPKLYRSNDCEELSGVIYCRDDMKPLSELLMSSRICATKK